MECKEYAHHLSRQVIAFPAPSALSLVLLNSLPVSGPTYSSFLSAFVPAASFNGMSLSLFFLTHNLVKTTSSWKPSINIPGRGPFSSVPEQSLPSSGKCWALLLVSSLCLLVFFPCLPHLPFSKRRLQLLGGRDHFFISFLPQHPVWRLLCNVCVC